MIPLAVHATVTANNHGTLSLTGFAGDGQQMDAAVSVAGTGAPVGAGVIALVPGGDPNQAVVVSVGGYATPSESEAP